LDQGGGEVAACGEGYGDGGGDGFAEGGEGEGSADGAFVLAGDGEREGRGAKSGNGGSAGVEAQQVDGWRGDGGGEGEGLVRESQIFPRESYGGLGKGQVLGRQGERIIWEFASGEGKKEDGRGGKEGAGLEWLGQDGGAGDGVWVHIFSCWDS